MLLLNFYVIDGRACAFVNERERRISCEKDFQIARYVSYPFTKQ